MDNDVHHGHRKRVRTRYLKACGLHDFEEHQILELILFYAYKQKDTNILAHRIINHFGSFAAVFEAPVEELEKIEGVGESTAILINLFLETYKMIEKSRISKIQYLNNTAEIGTYFLPTYINRKNEMVSILYLDGKKKILALKELAEGNFKTTFINIKSIVEQAVRLNAVYLVIAHNHPSGIAIPSNEDRATTRQIEEILKEIGIVLLDHLIFADNDFISFTESGLLKVDESTASYFGVNDKGRNA